MLPPTPFAYTAGWLSPTEADVLFADLLQSIAWEQQETSMYGRQVRIPRLTAW